jgi:CRISPR-associated protein Cmr4
MRTVVLGLLAETFLHPGAGDSLGVVDLPVAREAATSYPFVPGSGVKGALRDWWNPAEAPGLERLFGRQDRAGSLSVSDARLALLPVRSLDGPYAWVTCPYVLERLERDLRRAGLDPGSPLNGNRPDPGLAWVLPERGGAEPLVLEERSFTCRQAPGGDRLLTLLKPLVPEPARKRLQHQLVVLSDEDFAWFARFGLTVQARNVLDQETKTSKNLWYEEALPPDTLLYTLVAARDAGDLDAFTQRIAAEPYAQLGGNETVGQGWVRIEVLGSPGRPQ